MSSRILDRLKRITIGTKITLLYASIFAVILTVFSGFVMLNSWYFYRNVSKQELEKIVDNVAAHIRNGGRTNDEAISELKPDEYIDINIINLSTAKEDFSGYTFWMKPDDTLRQRFAVVSGRPDMRLKVVMQDNRKPPFMRHEKIIKYNGDDYLIQAVRPYNREQEIMNVFAKVFIVMNVLGIAAAYCMGRFISKRFLRPIVNIAKTAETIGINDLSQRIAIDGPDDEIKNLSVTFNDMIDRLEISFNKQNQFISDASHELRTPISVIQGYANLIDRWGKSDPDVLQEAIDSIKDETEHMSTLIRKLLFLARDEQNKKVMQKSYLSLNLIVNEVIKEMAVLEMSDKIEFSGKDGVYIYGDFDLIKQMLWIFLENSIKYTADDGKIEINVYSGNDRAYLTVSDNGTGIKDEDVPYIFDRFYRGDKSRSKEIPGSGLGLSIAKWIIDKHGARVSVESEFGSGSKFIIDFPLKNNEEANKS